MARIKQKVCRALRRRRDVKRALKAHAQASKGRKSVKAQLEVVTDGTPGRKGRKSKATGEPGLQPAAALASADGLCSPQQG